MERLTQWIDGNKAIPRVDLRKCGYEKCTTQLARYEDTGLAPEQIRQIDCMYAEKCREVAKLQQRDNPVKVKPLEIYHPVGYRVGQCSKCENIVRDYMKFCFECGCRLEWGSWEEWEETCKN